MDLKTILLADDDPRDIDLTLEALSEQNLANRVITVNDGADAMDYLTATGRWAGRDPGNPAVVMLDIKMPRMDGIEVLKRMRETEGLRTIPVVMLTSSREERDVINAYELGVNAYVVKPVDFSEFVSAVKGLGLFWGLLNEPPRARTGKERPDSWIAR